MKDAALVSTYAFGTGNAFEGVDPSIIRRAPATFDAEETDPRLARRKRGWIGDVKFVDCEASE